MKRKGICTLSNGAKVVMTFHIPPKTGGRFQEELERQLVIDFNESQPNMVNKVVDIHLMRN